jgi:hypothetical protein
MKTFITPCTVSAQRKLVAECETAVRHLGCMVFDVQEAARACDEEWSPTLTEHVLQIYGLLSAEHAFKEQALAMLKHEINGRFCQPAENLAVLANWICNKPGDMLPHIIDMLGEDCLEDAITVTGDRDRVPPTA